MINYANKIKEYRQRKCLTQKELSELLGVSKICIIRWEKGVFEPTMQIKKKLLNMFENEGMETFETRRN